MPDNELSLFTWEEPSVSGNMIRYAMVAYSQVQVEHRIERHQSGSVPPIKEVRVSDLRKAKQKELKTLIDSPTEVFYWRDGLDPGYEWAPHY